MVYICIPIPLPGPITGNSFYETTSFNPTSSVTYEAIQIINTSGVGLHYNRKLYWRKFCFMLRTWTKNANAKNNAFYAIYLNVGTSTPSSVQDNTIKSFSWGNSSSATWTGIHIQGGAVNIGTSTGNKIGVTTGTGSITITSPGNRCKCIWN